MSARADADGTAAYASAVALLQVGNHPAGSSALQSILKRRILPQHLEADARSNLGGSLSSMGRHVEAISQYAASIKLRPNSGHMHYNYALSLSIAGHTADAEKHYRLSAEYGPNSEAALNNLGNMLVGMGRRAEAGDAFRAAIRANPSHSLSHNNLGNILLDGNDEASKLAAGRAYATAVRLAPRYREAYKNLGNLLKQRPEWRPSAVRAYRVALDLLDPSGSDGDVGGSSGVAVGGTGGSRGGGSSGGSEYYGDVDAARQLLLNLGETLQWLGHQRASNLTFALGTTRGVWAHPQQRPTHFRHGLEGRAWWDVKRLPIIRRMLTPAALETIRADGLRLLRGDASSASAASSSSSASATSASAFRPYYSAALEGGSWTDVTLALSGSRQPGASHAPLSYALYMQLGEDALSMVMGSAYFSILSPGARLKPHCGPTNIRLRVHIGISVPDGAAMRVGNVTRRWADSDALVFDDSFEQ